MFSSSRWEDVPVPEPVRRIASAAATAVRGQLTIAVAAVAVLFIVVGVIAWEHTATAAMQRRGADTHAATHAAVHPDPPVPQLGGEGSGAAAAGPAPVPEDNNNAAAAAAASGNGEEEESLRRGGVFKEGPPAPTLAALGGEASGAGTATAKGTAEGVAEAAAGSGAAGGEPGAGAEPQVKKTPPPVVASLGRKFLSDR